MNFKNGQKKCPKMKTLDILCQIIQFCDHNRKLASGHQKNNSKIVIVIIFIKA